MSSMSSTFNTYNTNNFNNNRYNNRGKTQNQNAKKKHFIATSQLRVGFLILLKYLKKKMCH